MGGHKDIIIAIIAHSGDAETLKDFWPRWRGLSYPIEVFLPKNEEWPIPDLPDVTHHYGESSHSGPKLFRRINNLLQTLCESHYDGYVIIEPDCVPLRHELPEFYQGKMGGWFCNVSEPGVFPAALLPPWTCDKETARTLATKTESGCEKDHPDCKNLADRWLAKMCAEAGIRMETQRNSMGYIKHSHIKHVIRALNPAWIHGCKSLKELEAITCTSESRL